MTVDRPYRVYRSSVVGKSLYDTQPTIEAAESSLRTGRVEYPTAQFWIERKPAVDTKPEAGVV